MTTTGVAVQGDETRPPAEDAVPPDTDATTAPADGPAAHTDAADDPAAEQPATGTGTGTAAADGAAPALELDAAQRAAIEAAKAAKKARKAQQQAEKQAAKARRLAAEYARLAAQGEPATPAAVLPPETSDPHPAPVERRNDAVDVADASPRGRRPGAPVLTAAVALATCLVFAIVALVVHLSTASSAAPSATSVRDTVLISARQDIVVLNSLDYHDVDAGLRRWADASTGTLRDSFKNVTATEKNHIVAAKSVSTAVVLDAAVVSLDQQAGSATVIASVELTVTPEGGKAVKKRERQQAEVTRVDGTWKISSLAQVGVTVQ